MKRIILNTLRTLRATLVTVGLIVLLALWLLRSEWAQNMLTPYAGDLISNALGVEVSVGHVDFDLPAHAVLEDLEMKDHQGQRMFAAKRLKFGFGSYSLLDFLLRPNQNHLIRISDVQVQQPEAHLYRSRRDSVWNFAALGSDKPKKPSRKAPKIILDFPSIDIITGEFSMVDSTKSDSALAPGKRMNFSNMHFRELNGHINFHFDADQTMYGSLKDFNVVEVNSQQSIPSLYTEYLIALKPKTASQLSICLENTRLRIGRTNLDLDAELESIPPDSLRRKVHPDSTVPGFFPAFAAQIRPSDFDFQTLNRLLPKPLTMIAPVQVQGYLWGDMNAIYSDSIFIGLMEQTRLRTTLALKDFTDPELMQFMLGIDVGTLSFEELQRFLLGVKLPLSGVVGMKGTVAGNLQKLQTKKLEVRYLEHTRLLLDARITDYTHGENIFMDIKFKDSKFQFGEIQRLVPAMKLPEWLNRFGTCGLNGKFLGGVNDFVVNTDMTSAYGNIRSNLHLELPPKAPDIKYDGYISTENINFVALQANLPVESRYFNFEGKITGTGAEWGKIVADVDGKIHQSDVEGFHIDEVFTKELKIRGYKITGAVDVVDAQGSASVTVDLDVPDSSQNFIVIGDVKKLDMAHYRIFPNDSVFLSAVVNIDISGKDLESYRGRARFLQANLSRENSPDSLILNDMVLRARPTATGGHRIRLRSSVADMALEGDFKYQKAIEVMGNLAKEAGLYIRNNDSATAAWYAAKVIEPEGMNFHDTIITKVELNHLFQFLKIPMYLEDSTEILARFQHGAMDEFEVRIMSDSIGFSSVGLDNDSIYLSIQKDGTQNYFLGQGYVHVRELRIGKNMTFQNVSFEPTADASQVDYFLRASQSRFGSQYIISAQTNFKPGREINTQIRAAESKLVIRDKTWKFDPGNSIDHLYERPPSLRANEYPDSMISRYHVKGLKLSSEGQVISLGGVISKDRKDMMNIDIQNLSIKDVAHVMNSPKDIDGTLKRATVGAWNLLSGQPAIYGSGEVVNLRYEMVDSIGLKFYGGWPVPLMGTDYAGLRAVAGKWGQDSVIVKGWYNVMNDSIHFDSDSSSLQLSWIEPFVEDFLSNMKGRVALDDFKIRGTASKPELTGVARFTNTSFKVDYFQNTFRIGDNQLVFDNERIKISRIMIHDTIRGSAMLDGFVDYSDTAGLWLDLHVGQIRDLLFMNTRKKDNEVFYGRVVLDGDSARVRGYLTSPFIEAWVNTGEDSWLDIPISSYTSANRLDFVNFIQKGDTLATPKKKEFGGMRMTLNVNARPNARVRLIFDEFAGDIIEARGEGNIIVKLDESGEFLMYGAYILTEGEYLFTMENVVKKNFKVSPGGRIVFNGDPLDAQLDLDAIYKVNADMSSVLGSSSSGNRVPVEIVMHMKGSLMAPEIALELRLEMAEQDVFGLATFFQGIQYDQQELNKQVVSLLMFRRFSTASAASTGNSAANVTSSISELVSNQVNYWISQAFTDPKLGVEIESNEFQDVQLALKASLFNDRVTVERNGTLIGNTSGNLSIGDVIVLIKVLPKQDTTGKATVDPNAGQLVLEIFNREDASITNTNNVTRGVGLFYKKDFDRLKDILKRRQDMRKEEGMDLINNE